MNSTVSVKTVTISQELLDHIVNALTQLPYRDVQELFLQLGLELQQHTERPRIEI